MKVHYHQRGLPPKVLHIVKEHEDESVDLAYTSKGDPVITGIVLSEEPGHGKAVPIFEEEGAKSPVKSSTKKAAKKTAKPKPGAKPEEAPPPSQDAGDEGDDDDEDDDDDEEGGDGEASDPNEKPADE